MSEILDDIEMFIQGVPLKLTPKAIKQIKRWALSIAPEPKDHVEKKTKHLGLPEMAIDIVAEMYLVNGYNLGIEAYKERIRKA